MAEQLILKNKPTEKPLSEWGTVAVELIGTATRIVQGERFHHRIIECGEGEPLFLLHGIGGCAETYARNIRNLADNGFHVYAIDMLYHGFSSKEPWSEDNTLRMQTEAFVDLVRALGYSKVNASGESMGGMVLFNFGLRYPEMAGKLVINTGFYSLDLDHPDFQFTTAEGTKLQELSQESVTNPSFDSIRNRMNWLVAEPDRMTDEMVNLRLRMYGFPEIYASMQNIYRMGREWPSKPLFTEADLKSFTPDALVLWTEKNPGRGPDYGKYCADLLQNAQFYSIDDAGHWPQWERPLEHDQVLIEYLTS